SGYYFNFEEGKGCAVGCSLNSIAQIKKIGLDCSEHNLYEEYLGVPEWLAKVEDTIFEGIPDKRRKTWPVEFGEAINEGADLNKIKVPFIVYILQSNIEVQKRLLKNTQDKEIRGVIKDSIKVNKQMIKAQEKQDKD